MASAVFLGLATIDVIYAVEGLPRENVKGIAQRQEVVCGGPATNAAIACAFLGTSTKLITAVGQHPFGRVIRDELAQFNVEVIDLASSSGEAPSMSTIFVNVANGTRTIVSGHVTRPQVAAEAFSPEWLDGASVLMLDGHHMDCAIRAAAAVERGIPVVLDGGSWKERMEELLRNVTYAVCSENFHAPGTSSPKEVFEFLRAHGVEGAAVTRGHESTLWVEGNEFGEVEVPAIAAVDTTAAGDVFHGALCHAMMTGQSFRNALQWAAKVASYSCQFFGTRSWMCSWGRSELSGR